MSQETKDLHEQRKKEYSKGKPTKERRKRWNKKISRSCRSDYRKWVTRWTERIEKDFRAGNAKAIYAGVKTFCDTKKSFTTKQPSLNSKGTRIENPEELADVWKKFLYKKFSPTELEKLREEFDALSEDNGQEELERKEFEDAVRHMKMERLREPTGSQRKFSKIPALRKTFYLNFFVRYGRRRRFRQSSRLKFLSCCTRKGCLMIAQIIGVFLLNHAFKILSVMLMKRLVKETEGFLSD